MGRTVAEAVGRYLAIVVEGSQRLAYDGYGFFVRVGTLTDLVQVLLLKGHLARPLVALVANRGRVNCWRVARVIIKFSIHTFVKSTASMRLLDSRPCLLRASCTSSTLR
jgi:hypothetical protein